MTSQKRHANPRIVLVAVLRHKMISCVRVRYEDSQIVSFSPNFAVGATMP